MTIKMSRRAALVTGLASLSSTRLVSAAPVVRKSNPVCVFTKPFNSLTFEELADSMAALGVDGIEAPIRAGGHIEPEAVPDKLPKLVEALRQRGLEITVLTSDINDAGDPMSARTLKVAADLGIKRYRMKYFTYDVKIPVAMQLDLWQKKFVELAQLNSELGIKALYQNHAGNKQLGAPLWDLAQIFERSGVSTDHIAVAYDIRHATIEGGMSWPITFRRILPYIDTVYVKDARWTDKRAENVPLGEGIVDPKFFKMLAEANFSGPISLHEEYLDHRKPELVAQHLTAIQQDLVTLRGWLP